MDALEAELEAILAEARRRGLTIVVLGAFAVRAYLRDPDSRVTNDIDVLVDGSSANSLTKLLEERGYRIYDTGSWLRAERAASTGRVLVDIALDEVVDVATFQAYPLAAESVPQVGARPVPAFEDLLALKLLAHRDKDLLDVVAMLRDTSSIDHERFARCVESRDLEIPVRRGYLELVAATDSGALAELWLDRYGNELDQGVVDLARNLLQDLFT